MTVCNKELGPISLLEMFFFEQEGLSLHTLGRRIDFESFMNPLCYLLPRLKLQGLRNVISDSKAPVCVAARSQGAWTPDSPGFVLHSRFIPARTICSSRIFMCRKLWKGRSAVGKAGREAADLKAASAELFTLD